MRVLTRYRIITIRLTELATSFSGVTLFSPPEKPNHYARFQFGFNFQPTTLPSRLKTNEMFLLIKL